jgi:lipopolysaccharide transport system ATP-binding protein
MKKAIIVENISKVYKLGEYSTGTFSQDIEMYIRNMFGLKNDFKPLNESLNKSGYHRSLNNISFELEEGDSLGIVGKNGAGKSTLLKILSRITTPTSGEIKLKGRVASLLEVGTGFHPELTGRENIYLNGAILGMKKNQIKEKLDEIIDFSGVEEYIDTPVKRYSSGMYVRLAFAVAAFLESEILFLDEVLAVGDIDFQNKSLSKINSLSSNSGKTIIFVSHNMSLISKICNKSILLDKGNLLSFGPTDQIIDQYSKMNDFNYDIPGNMDDIFMSSKFLLINSLLFNNSSSNKIIMGLNRKLNISLSGELFQDLKFSLEFRISDTYGRKIFMYCPSHLSNNIYSRYI